MKKYKKLLALVAAVVFVFSNVAFAADIDFEKIIENTNREYSEYVDKALNEAKNSGIIADEDRISILLWQEPANIDDSIEPNQVFVFVPEKNSEDVYGYAYYENGKSAGVAKNFDFGGNLEDIYSEEVETLLAETENPEEITNLLISGRLAFMAYYIDAEEDYIYVYDILEESKYNEMEVEKYEIELKKLYEEEEFVKILKAEEKAYREYISKKEDKEVTYKDNDGDVKEEKPAKKLDDECDYDREDCENEDCIEDAAEEKKEKAEKEKTAKKEKREKKIKEIKDYGVFEGNEKGELKEDESISRAEFAVVVCKMLGIEPAKGQIDDEFDFDDVDDKHWAKEYIKAARKSGFISGRGGNKYDPDAKISYEEAQKILVAVMGYTPLAQQKGGYPYGYSKVANELGIDRDLFFENKKEALRGDVMEMVYNCLDVPWMTEKSFGENIQYEIADGKNGEEKTLRIILEFKIEE